MIKLVKSSFYHEKETKKALSAFIDQAETLSMNTQCEAFERRFAQKQGRQFAVFTSNGSSANLVLIQAMLNLGRFKTGGKIGVSALTWSTNIMPLMQLGLKPVLLDCELESLNVSPNIIKKTIDNLQGIFLTNVLGFADNITEIKKICSEKNIVLLEDNCESLGSTVDGNLLGNFSLASTFSFFVGHHLSTIEGGMVCTDDEELYKMLLLVRAHGWDRNLPHDSQKELRQQNNIDDFYAKYTFYDLGYNARPTEISGFLGNEQIKYWDEIVSKRQENFFKFQAAVKQNKNLIPLNLSHMGTISNFNMPVVAKNKKTFQKYMEKFLNADIEIRPIIAGDMALQPFYKKYLGETTDCPNARHVHDCGFYFPNNAELTNEEVNFMCGLLE